MQTYHLGSGWNTLFITGHACADLELFVEVCSVNCISKKTFLSLCLLTLTGPDNDNWHSLRDRDAECLDLQVNGQVFSSHD